MMKKTFNTIFIPFFDEQGFKPRSGGQFSRVSEDVEHLIACNPIKTTHGYYSLSVGAGIRIPAIEKVWRPAGEYADTPTVAMPVHLLKPDKTYRPWKLREAHELETHAPKIQQEVRTWAIPFLDRFPSSREVLERLRSDKPSDWFMCTEGNRDAILVFFELLENGRERAVALGGELLGKYEGKAAKYSSPLREALKQVNT